MVAMWDQCFQTQSPLVQTALQKQDYETAFEAMHQVLDGVWVEAARVLQLGGLCCVNIGDATKKCGGDFRLFSNHSRIIQAFSQLGFQIMPDILWRKKANTPNKFLGSGMQPAGGLMLLMNMSIF